jgi:hypothetical protein
VRFTRALLGLVGVAAAAWGVLLLLDRPDGLLSVLVWAAGGVLVHDLVVAPVSILVGALLARVLPAGARAPVLLLVAGWALVGVAVGNVLSGQGGKPDNPSLLTGSYVAAWSVLTVAVAAVVVVVVLRARRPRTRPT